MMDIMGKTALITGGGHRLGKACALALAHRGVHILLHYFHSREKAAVTAEEIRDLGVRCTILKADLSDPVGGRSLFENALHEAGGVDILINSASFFAENTMLDMEWEELLHSTALHGYNPLTLSRLMAAQKRRGSIINILDARNIDYDYQHFSYHLGKRMLHSITRTMALEFAPLLRVNGIAPGIVLPPEGVGDDYRKKLASSAPLEMTGTPEHITDALLFLSRNDFITGQIIYVDGGRNMKGAVYG